MRNFPTPFNFSQSSSPSFFEQDYSPVSAWKRDFDWSPFAGFRREVDRLFHDFFAPAPTGYGQGYGNFQGYWPTIDLKETDDEVIVTAEVPGMSEKDVELYFDKGMLTIRGFKKADKDEPGYSERFFGRFERQLALPHSVDGQHSSAEFRDGLLSVHFKKLAEPENKKKIPINAAASSKVAKKEEGTRIRQPEFAGA